MMLRDDGLYLFCIGFCVAFLASAILFFGA